MIFTFILDMLFDKNICNANKLFDNLQDNTIRFISPKF